MQRFGRQALSCLPVKSVGVMGDERTYEYTIALRAVTSVDGMTADWAHLPYEFLANISNEIINNVKGSTGWSMISAVNPRPQLNGNKIKRMKKILFGSVVCILLTSAKLFAQDSLANTKPRIAVFVPLFLDSAFDAFNDYRYEEDFPRFISPGLEFYEGVQLAIDSLNKTGVELEVYIYDTKSTRRSLAEELQDAVDKKVQLIIAHVEGKELFQFTSVAKNHAIPFINANLPNDGGITNNAYFVLLNSTLRTHCEGIYKYLQKNYPVDNIIVFRRKGQMEDLVKSYFDTYASASGSVPLRLKYVDLPVNFKLRDLTAHLDSTKKTICVGASLDTAFCSNLTMQLASVASSYHPVIIGMPTWSNRDFTKPLYKGLEIVYSTPFYNSREDKVSEEVVDYFNTHFYARPSDMVIRGYETMWKFSRMLQKYGNDLASNITNKEFALIRTFDIQPVLSKSTLTLDYFENKRLYFVKWLDGAVKEVK